MYRCRKAEGHQHGDAQGRSSVLSNTRHASGISSCLFLPLPFRSSKAAWSNCASVSDATSASTSARRLRSSSCTFELVREGRILGRRARSTVVADVGGTVDVDALVRGATARRVDLLGVYVSSTSSGSRSRGESSMVRPERVTGILKLDEV